MVGSRDGWLREYDGAGAVVGPTVRLPGGGRANQIVWDETAAGWLVATPDGVYRHQPGSDMPERLSKDMSHGVAASAGRAAYATNTSVTCSDGRILPFAATVRDVHLDPTSPADAIAGGERWGTGTSR